jgi:hypothetical protein
LAAAVFTTSVHLVEASDLADAWKRTQQTARRTAKAYAETGEKSLAERATREVEEFCTLPVPVTNGELLERYEKMAALRSSWSSERSSKRSGGSVSA